MLVAVSVGLIFDSLVVDVLRIDWFFAVSAVQSFVLVKC